MDFSRAYDDLDVIFRAGLSRVDPYRMIRDHVRLEGSRLLVSMEDQEHDLDLEGFQRIFILGTGKATAPMARAFEEILGERVSDGLIVVKYGHTADLKRVRMVESGHPVPDESGVEGSGELMRLADEADDATLVLTLVSGGGSALLPSPMSYEVDGKRVDLSLSDKQETTKALLRCGAEIKEINCIRKHLSGLKGGRLLGRIAPARSMNFILSDVVGDDLSSIASGLTAVDPTTYEDALAIVEKYGIADSVPEKVVETLKLGKEGRIPETLKPGSEAAELSTNILIGTNAKAMAAAGEKARELGYELVSLTSRITGEAREVARFLSAIAADQAESELLAAKPCCVISGGEPVVTLMGQGKGGRCQEMALAYLMEMRGNPELFEDLAFLSASTDGNDGPTDAAGAFATLEMLRRAQDAGLSLTDYLRENDSYHFFEKIDGLYKTGPTNTNVCDLHIILAR
jgi:hydroxypyruvate reductase